MGASKAKKTNLAKPRLVIGLTGASGVQYGVRLLEVLQNLPYETHLVISEGAKRVMTSETKQPLARIKALASEVHDDRDVGAGIASGSFVTAGMVVVPCSASSLAKIAHGIADTLITRTAHVHLKERRPLVLVPRETPYSRPMLEAMLRAFDAGARIVAANPGFYNNPQTVGEIVDFVVARVLDQLTIEHEIGKRWKDPNP